MDGKKEFLTEENYERGKKKVITIALIVLVLGLLIGGSLIATGIIKSSHVETTSSSARSKDTIQAEIDSLNSELATLKAKKNQEFTSNGFSEEYYRLDNEIKTKQSKVIDLETEIWKADSGFNSTKDSISKAKYVPFYMFGAFIIIASCMISGSIYMFAKRREITAFTAQQVMPVAQEGIEKMAPTVGNAAGSIAQGITKGIKEGLKDSDNNK